MKTKNYLFLVLSLALSLTTYSQTSPPWDFNNTLNGFDKDKTGVTLVAGQTFATYTLSTNAAKFAGIRNANANINTTLGNFLAVTIKNQTLNAGLKIRTVVAGVQKFRNQVITTNDADFKTYYIDMSGDTNWTGTLNDISLRFTQVTNDDNLFPVDGTILIDNIELISVKTDYTFDNISDNEGFASGSFGNVVVTHPTSGELNVEMKNLPIFPKISQNTHNIAADIFKAVQVTFINNSTKNILSFESPQTTPEYATNTIPITSDATSIQTVIIDLSTLTNWTGLQNIYSIQFLQDNPAVKSGGTIIIKQILFGTDVNSFPRTWNGNTSKDWADDRNWSNGTLPADTDNVVINASPLKVPNIDSGVTVNDLTVNSSLVINSTGALKVTGTATGTVLIIET